MKLDYRGTKRVRMVFPCGCVWEEKLSSYGATTVVDAYTQWVTCEKHDDLNLAERGRPWNDLRREDFEEFLAATGYTEADTKKEEEKPVFELDADMVRGHPWGYEPQPGKKYVEVDSACPACREAGRVLEGHFACWPESVPAGGLVVARILDGGWKALVEI